MALADWSGLATTTLVDNDCIIVDCTTTNSLYSQTSRMDNIMGRELFHRAHYNVLAKRIRELRQETEDEFDSASICLDKLVYRLAEWFKEDNPRFNEALWMEATSNENH